LHKKKKSTGPDFMAVRESLSKAQNAEEKQREEATEDFNFAFADKNQWDKTAIALRGDRPRYTVNKLRIPLLQLVGEVRQNDISIKVRATGGGATEEVANTFQGLIRNTENVSNAKDAYCNAFLYSSSAGFGAWRITTEFEEDSFDQSAKIKKIDSPLSSVYFDPDATEYDKRDGHFAWIISQMTLEEFKRKYPKAKASSIDLNMNDPKPNFWSDKETVRVAEYWYKVHTPIEYIKMSNGKVYSSDKLADVTDELALAGVTEVERRDGVKTNVFQQEMSGAEFLTDPKPFPSKFIPIIPCYGLDFYTEGQHSYSGLVRVARDPQRIYNYIVTTLVETTALTPKDPIFITADQMAGFEKDYTNFNNRPLPFMRYNADPKTKAPPYKVGAPSVQAELSNQSFKMEGDIQQTLGRTGQSVGDDPSVRSGRAVMALQNQADSASFLYMDNLSRSVQYTGEILVDMYPRFIDAGQQERIIKPDGQEEFVTINEETTDSQTGKKVILNDIMQGKYDVSVDTGPSFQTKRTEALNFLTTLAQANPLVNELAADLIAKNADFPQAEELAARLRKVGISQGFIEPNEEEQRELEENAPPPDPLQQELAAQNMITLQLANEKSAAEVDILVKELEKLDVEIENIRSETRENLADADKTEAETTETVVKTTQSLINGNQ